MTLCNDEVNLLSAVNVSPQVWKYVSTPLGYGEELEEVLELPLPLEVKKKILWDNAASFYGIQRAAATS